MTTPKLPAGDIDAAAADEIAADKGATEVDLDAAIDCSLAYR